MSSPSHVIIIGAGVTGLTSAIFLAEAGYTITLLAAHLPGDASIEYTSPWAGAHWRTSASPEEPLLCDWDVQTFNYWRGLLEQERRSGDAGCGLKMQESLHFWDHVPREQLWWAPHVIDFTRLSVAEEPVKAINAASRIPVRWAARCRAPSINVPQYLLYLQERARSLGVEIQRTRLPTDGGLEKALRAAGKAACFVNASGIGARELCGDDAVYPIRGQTVLVKGEATATRTRNGEGYVAYCIPRPGSGTTILGGTKEEGVWSGEVDEGTTEAILERCAALAPELRTGVDGGFEVVSVQCGLRPGRTGGPRVEGEVVGGKKVVHAYGHASGGYQNSIGSARLVVQLVDEALATTVKARL